MRFYWFLTIGFLLFGCKAVDNSGKTLANPKDIRLEKQDLNPKIVFLYFEMESRVENEIEIRLMQTQISEGRMKDNAIRQAPKVDGNLVVQLLDEKGQVQIEQIIENPLVSIIEQYSEDGEIISNHLEMEKTQFFTRFNYKDTIKTLKIYSIQSGYPIEVYHKPIQI